MTDDAVIQSFRPVNCTPSPAKDPIPYAEGKVFSGSKVSVLKAKASRGGQDKHNRSIKDLSECEVGYRNLPKRLRHIKWRGYLQEA